MRALAIMQGVLPFTVSHAAQKSQIASMVKLCHHMTRPHKFNLCRPARSSTQHQGAVTCCCYGALFLQEMELRTLKVSADDIASKFNDAVAALANKRLDVLMEVSNCRAQNQCCPVDARFAVGASVEVC